MIVYYPLSLFIVNVAKCDYFILLSLYIFFIYMQFPLSISHCFCKNILKLIRDILRAFVNFYRIYIYIYILWGPIAFRGAVQVG